MIRQVFFGAGIVVAVSVIVWQIVGGRFAGGGGAHEAAATSAGPVRAPAFRVTDELIEDGWVDATRAAGADQKPLEHSANSICFLTKIEIKGIQSPEDANSCTIGIDEFTGYWQVTAEVAEGGHSAVRCNARCLVWE
ncbi:MAG TPA: hypothetical protein VIC71_03115 [Gammaproteobacteria bacterium]|jgi:hypothetical protein